MQNLNLSIYNWSKTNFKDITSNSKFLWQQIQTVTPTVDSTVTQFGEIREQEV